MNSFTIPAPISLHRIFADGGRTLLLAAIYFFTAQIGLGFFEAVNGFASLVWPPSGIALAAVLLIGYRISPGIFLGAFLVNFLNGAPLLSAFGIGLGNTLEAIIAAYLLKRILHFQNTFDREKDVIGYFFFAGCLAPMIPATMGTVSLWLAGIVPFETFGATWRAWWTGDLIGIVLITPIILLWSSHPRLSFSLQTTWEKVIEVAVVSLLFSFTLLYVFTNLFSSFAISEVVRPYPYFVFLPLSWIALRFGARTTILATFFTAIVAIFGTVQGWGPFISPSLNIRLYQVEIFSLITVATMLLMATMVASSRRNEENLGDRGVTFMEAQALSQTGSWELDNGTLVWSNELYRIYGFSSQEEKVSRETFILHAHPEDQAMVRQALNDAFDRHKMINIYYRIMRPDGTLRYLQAMAKPLASKGWSPKIIGVSKDITERKMGELGLEAKTTELEQALLALQKSDKAKTHFLAVLSHELRNPLASILSAVELLQLRGELNPETKKSMNIIDRQVQNLKTLLGDLLDLSRIEQGKIQLRKYHVDVREIITRAAETAAPTIEARKHSLQVTLPTHEVVLFGDSLRLEQSIVNLLYNASKFSEPGSLILLTCMNTEKHIVISVKDEGIGIEQKFLEKIFEPFSDFDRPSTSLRGGLGIGLKLVKALIELHGGTVEAKSEGLGKGSEFIIRLPKGEPRDISPPVRAEQNESTTTIKNQQKILVVDDNQSAATAMSALLTALGYDALHAFSGRGTLTMIEQFSPDFFLLDIGMPDMDGYELAQELRNRPAHKDAILIAVSGYGQYEDQKRSRKAGFNEHLTKPVSARELQNIIQKYSKTEGGNAELH